MPKAGAFEAAKYRDNPKMIAKYLNHALATGDAILITKAIGRYDPRSKRDTSFAEDRVATRQSLQII